MDRVSCRHIRKKLSAYLDGELNLKLRILVEDHLQECRPCQTFFTELKELRESLTSFAQSTVSAEPPTYMPDKISSRLPKYDFGIFTDPVIRNSALDIALLFLIITFGLRLWQAPQGLISEFTLKPQIYKTEPGSNLRIAFNKEDNLFIKENSYLQIKSLFPRTEIILKYGEVLVKKKSQEQNLIINTSFAKIEVIGTIFKVLAKEDTTEVILLEGRLLIRYGGNIEVLSENKKAIITQGFQAISLKNLSLGEVNAVKEELAKLDLVFPGPRKPVSKRPAIIQWREVR
jgi:hypothetical protein